MLFEWELVEPTNLYLRANKTTGFVAKISSGVTVAKMTDAIQAWKKPSAGTKKDDGTLYKNTMTFNEELNLDMRTLPLTKSKWIFFSQEPIKILQMNFYLLDPILHSPCYIGEIQYFFTFHGTPLARGLCDIDEV